MRRAVRPLLISGAIVSGCSARPSPDPVSRPEAQETNHDDAWVTRRCAEEYAGYEANWATYTPKEKATSDFKHCPKWRMAAAGACGAPVQPSFMNPCQCMCDLCAHDSECAAHPGGACVSMSSVQNGGYEERVCVYEADICHPKNQAQCQTRCVTLFGHPQCVSK